MLINRKDLGLLKSFRFIVNSFDFGCLMFDMAGFQGSELGGACDLALELGEDEPRQLEPDPGGCRGALALGVKGCIIPLPNPRIAAF